MNEEEKLILRRLKSGEETAFKKVVELYYKKIYYVIFGLVHNCDDAKELTQEVFLRVYKNIHKFKEESSLYTWIFRIALNLCIDHRRKMFRKKNAMEQSYDDSRKIQNDEMVMNENPEISSIRRNLYNRVMDAIYRLPKYYREVLILREVEGMSYEEISNILSCPMGTVMSRLHSAKAKLREELSPYLKEAIDG